ncbi:kinase-like domain-containing protein [Nemania serpens]|nr:kinase-like domain-containing protein [Nemania serpens]
MRLLNIDSLEPVEFIGDSLPPYTILSHTWGPEEVTYYDLRNGGLATHADFFKLQALCDQTRRDGFEFTWIDTCCIDRSSSAELSESLNSMYQWYSKAEVCYVHLSDVYNDEGEEIDRTRAFYHSRLHHSSFHHSRWFTRSWTLPELLAPSLVVFFDASWNRIGTKKSLLPIISTTTGIPQSCLSGESLPADFSVATRFSWASRRTCTKREDMAYSLMGLFHVNMPLLYGEGDRAFLRLQEEIIKRTDDQSILAWAVSKEDSRCFIPSSVFAESPADFANAAGIRRSTELEPPPSVLTNRGLSISLPFARPSACHAPPLFEDGKREELTEIQTAYLNCETDAQHVVQIALIPIRYSPLVHLSSATFYRLATPLMLADRPSDPEYKNIYISMGLGNLLRRTQTTACPRNPGQESSHSQQRAIPPDPVQHNDQTGFSVVKGILVPKENILDAVVDILNDKMVSNIAGRLFLPEGTLNQVLDEYVMSRLLRDLLQPCISSAKTIENTPLLLRCRKIFAILTLSGLLQFFQVMVNELSISDECLPMPDPDFLAGSALIIGNKNTEHLEKWKLVANLFGRKVFVRMFFEKQWCALAPVFKVGNHIEHYSLSQNHILPFVRSISCEPEVDIESPAKDHLVSGGFGVVQRVCIHPNHHDFISELGPSENTPAHTSSNFFAVKKLPGVGRKVFEAERSTLERFRKPGAPNIIQLLATYEVRSDDMDRIPMTYNLLFPWADEDLKTFWESERYLHNEHIVPWIAEQCWKLADGLSVIHMGYMVFGSTLHEPEHFYGIHGDIKPSNILRFVTASTGEFRDLGRLVIGDFGLSHFHRKETRSKISTSSIGFSDTYSAPEFLVEKHVSQKIDIWALGCVFLEFITWFLMGPDSVNRKFGDLRIDADAMAVVRSDRFFQAVSHDDGQPPVARVKPVVQQWMHILRNAGGCSQYFHDLLDLIDSRMLVVRPHERIQADELSRKLEEMYQQCLRKPQYYHSDGIPRRRIAENGSKIPDSAVSTAKRKSRPLLVCSLMKRFLRSPKSSHRHAPKT